MLRVLMVTPRYLPDIGGVERHVFEVAHRLARLDCDVTVSTTDRVGDRPPRESRNGVSIRRVPAWPRRRDYYFAPGIVGEVNRQRWDVVHVQSYHTLVAPLAMLSAIRAKIPFVLTFHGGGHSSRARTTLRGTQRKVLAPLVRRADRLVAVARFEIDVYGRELGIPPERFTLIPNGRDERIVPAGPLPDSESGPVVASVGRLERYKGHHRVLAAFPRVLAARPDARLWIVGQGPEEQSLRRLADRLAITGHVELGHVAPDDPHAMAELLARTTLVVQLSDFESHPVVALEAVSVGRRPLVSDTSGLRELADDGLARAIPLDSSPAAIADAILYEIEHPGSPAPHKPFTWDDCAGALLGLYRDVASTRS